MEESRDLTNRFNIRVYGLLLRGEQVLVAHETLRDFAFSKFPGGGLEFGEGIEDCLKREYMEELGISIRLNDLFYVNEFFQRSAFNNNEQVVSLYYFVEAENPEEEKKLLNCIDSGEIRLHEHHLISFEWKPVSRDLQTELTFPIDKQVASRLFSRNSS